METVRELLRQVWEGDDFTPPSKLLANVSAKSATIIPASAPYSIATNVAHADIWQRLWLARLKGEPKFNPFPDFPAVPSHDWETVRTSFLVNFALAVELAGHEPFEHQDPAKKLLTKIAIHNAYHLGQVALLKRILRSEKRHLPNNQNHS